MGMSADEVAIREGSPWGEVGHPSSGGEQIEVDGPELGTAAAGVPPIGNMLVAFETGAWRA